VQFAHRAWSFRNWLMSGGIVQNAMRARVFSGVGFDLPAQASAAGPHAIRPAYLLVRERPTPEIEGLWQDFMGRVEFPDHYTSPHYFLEPHWRGKNPFAILAMNEGRVTGVLTGLDEGKQVTCGLPGRPQVLIDPTTEARTTAAALAEALVSEFPRARLITACSWSSALAPEFERRHFHVRELKTIVVLDLRLGAEALFQSFHDGRKRNIRTAIRRGVGVSEVNTAQDLADYWDVYCAWLKTPRKTIHSDRNFDKAEEVHRLRATHRRFLARAKGKAIAATTVRFFPGGLIEYSANCSLDEFNGLRPNDLLIWRTIQWACDHGFSRYSLGASHPFLQRCGGAIVPIYRYRLDRTFLQRVEMQERATAMGVRVLNRLRASGSVAKKGLKLLAGGSKPFGGNAGAGRGAAKA
jgi:hypothetical protein